MARVIVDSFMLDLLWLKISVGWSSFSVGMLTSKSILKYLTIEKDRNGLTTLSKRAKETDFDQ
jgi:hypothetical protein